MQNFIKYSFVTALLFTTSLGVGQINATWTDLLNTTVQADKLLKTSGANAWGDAGAASNEALPDNTDGWIQTTALESTTARMIGLSENNINASHSSIGFALYLRHDGELQIYENGIKKFGSSSTRYQSQDVLKITRANGIISYQKNGETFYTSTVASSSPLIVDLSLHHVNATINQVILSNSFSSSSNGSSLWSTSGSTVFYENGNVGIGTNDTKGYQLAVEGKIISEEVRVAFAGSWPDFVFENSYDLKELNDLQDYIRKYKHLPEIPSGAVVNANGIHLGEMDAKLLQKIEELTLYLIAQNKEIQELKREMLNLKHDCSN